MHFNESQNDQSKRGMGEEVDDESVWLQETNFLIFFPSINFVHMLCYTYYYI